MIAADGNAGAAARGYDFRRFFDGARQIFDSRFAPYGSSSNIDGCTRATESRRDAASGAATGSCNYGDLAA